MLISEVAKKSGLTKDTVRYYTQLGILEANKREAGSRLYADYPDEVIELLEEIKLAKSAGFTLSEIREGISEYAEGKLTPERMVEIFTEKLKEVKQKQQGLKDVEAMLRMKIKKYSSLK